MVLSELLFLSCTAHRVCSLTTTVAKRTAQVNYSIQHVLFHTVALGSTLNSIQKTACLYVLTVVVNCQRLYCCAHWVTRQKKFLKPSTPLTCSMSRPMKSALSWYHSVYVVRLLHSTSKTIKTKLSLKKVAGLLRATLINWKKLVLPSLLFQLNTSLVSLQPSLLFTQRLARSSLSAILS